MNVKEYTVDIGNKKLTAQFTDLAEQANGSVILRYGNSAVLATAVMSSETREGLDYFPLTVDYEEKFYAAGEILGSRFMRREGRPSEEAVLSGRVVDRTIRPLFDKHIRNEVQVVITILAIDEDDPDILAVNAASLALATSDIPWHGPVSAVRIGKQNGATELTVNPIYSMRSTKESQLDLVACGRDGTINMIEVSARELAEDHIMEGFEKAQEELLKLQKFQEKIVQDIGKRKQHIPQPETPKELASLFEREIAPQLETAIFNGAGMKTTDALKRAWLTQSSEVLPDINVSIAADYFEARVDARIHDEALQNDKRADGRKMHEIRPLYAQAGGTFDALHGSGIFYRGGTHVFSVLTLGGPDDSLIIDSMEEQEVHKHFMHHYNFPPFSTGETGRLGGVNRRMIGHGALAEKALAAVIPDKNVFPYTIRVVSEVMSSNGSTSMASTCAATLALMDGGVPITSPVAGIALGLMSSPGEGSSMHKRPYKILTDIQGPEDHYGDMDFKVAGTKHGVTAVQMDVKVDGIPLPILREAFERGREARLKILTVIQDAIAAPRDHISERAPHITMVTIKPDQIGLVIGSGGKTINELKDRTKVEEITIEANGAVYITGSRESVEQAAAEIAEMTREYAAGERFEGEVTRITHFGAFVKIGKNTEGLVHISEIAPFRIENVSEYLHVGQHVPVIIKNVDEKERVNLSIKEADASFIKQPGQTK
jgi:polyribonucleotide nucleotidyltransferase